MKFRNIFLGLIAPLLVFVLIPAKVLAFGISPAIIDLSGTENKTLDSSFEVINTSNTEQTYYFRIVSFFPDKTIDNPLFAPVDPSLGFPNWITISTKSLRVPAESRVPIPFSVTIPASTSSDSDYAAILVSRAPEDFSLNYSGASVEASTAILLFLNIEKNNASQKIEVVDISLSEKNQIVPYLFGSVDVIVQNQGGLYAILEGNVEVIDMFGRHLRNFSINETKERILPGANQNWSFNLGDKKQDFLNIVKTEWSELIIGPIKIKVNLKAKNQQLSQKEIVLWLMPWHLVMMFIVIVTFIFGVGTFLKRLVHKRE